MKVVITDNAWDDLLAIGKRIQADNPKRAESFVEELYQCCRELANMPFAFAAVRGPAEGIRRRRHGNYLIFYRVASHQLEVLHVLHAARDYERIVFGDPD